jgi:hypothetical protein
MMDTWVASMSGNDVITFMIMKRSKPFEYASDSNVMPFRCGRYLRLFSVIGISCQKPYYANGYFVPG